MESMKTSMIGKTLFPLDNSQSYNLLTKEDALLAGTSEKPSQIVTIISEPYKVKYMFIGNEYEDEFVTVLHEGEPYIILNSFSYTHPYKN